jgi:hypothetical protein
MLHQFQDLCRPAEIEFGAKWLRYECKNPMQDIDFKERLEEWRNLLERIENKKKLIVK